MSRKGVEAKTRGDPEAVRRYKELSDENGLLPVKVTPFYRIKIDEELSALGREGGPLFRAAYPTEEKLGLRVPGEVADFVDCGGNTACDGRIIRKYRDRLLFCPTLRCFGHCMYCFRQKLLRESADGGEENESKARIEESLLALVAYIKSDRDIKELIISGGDPLTLGAGRLGMIMERIRSSTAVRDIRVHTRAIVYEPEAFGRDMIAMLTAFKPRLVFHIVHPYELCDRVRSSADELGRKGIPLYNQFPILRKVNDHPFVIRSLLSELDRMHVRNLSIFFPEPVYFSACFRIPLRRIFRIMDEINLDSPAWINSTRWCQDTAWGKVRREDLLRFENGDAVFGRQGREIRVPDFPGELDEAGDPKVMMWRDPS